eukprot:GHRR01001574.1.p1 GENE.GHRR01001574.1~~GHRR01001574.1.p1  ORF type:complete len:355 (+),score=176.98 GHRR01001574.1:219-1283(+)
MASLVNANLPSEDEEDDDYDPSKDPTGEKDPKHQQQNKAQGKKRGAAALAADLGVEQDGVTAAAAAPSTAAEDDYTHVTPAQAAKKAKISAMWEQLQQASTGSANMLSRSTISLASLCSNTNSKTKRSTDLLWMKTLGIKPNRKHGLVPAPIATTTVNGHHPAAGAAASTAADKARQPDQPSNVKDTAADTDDPQSQQQQQQDPSSSIRAAAAAALAAAKEGALGGVVKSYNKVTVTETRRFAGKDIQVAVQVDKDSKEAKRAADRAAAADSGLDAFLNQIESKKKVSVLDKSKMDWQDYKTTDSQVQEELEAHRRSDKQYLDKQDFLKRAELREYEIERDKRLASDVRLRGRL